MFPNTNYRLARHMWHVAESSGVRLQNFNRLPVYELSSELRENPRLYMYQLCVDLHASAQLQSSYIQARDRVEAQISKGLELDIYPDF